MTGVLATTGVPGKFLADNKDLEESHFCTEAQPGHVKVDIHGPVAPLPYTAFSNAEKRFITLLIGLAMMFSPLSANIYLPCLPLLQQDLRVTPQLINLTVTTYVICQGIAPAFFGELSDKVGRRPVYIITFAIYVGANIGMAVQHSYVALLILRMLQSLGASATVAIGYGVVADVTTPAERGKVLGPAMIATNLGPILGPLIGGPLADHAGWRWVFWLLTILGGVFLLTLLLFFPETCRNIVGNRSAAPKGWSKPWLSFSSRKFTNEGEPKDSGRPRERMVDKIRAIIPNPWKSIRIIFHKNTSVVLAVSAVFYAVYYIIQASLPHLFLTIYGFNETDIGLCYLAIGCGVAIGGYLNGKFMDYNYRMTAKKIGFEIDKVVGDDLTHFPIERARSRFAVFQVILHSACILGYGWALHRRAHVAVPLILQFFVGFFATCIVQTFNTLLVDLYRDNPSTAAASGNITRCALSAGGVAVMQPLIDRIGEGVFFSVLAAASGVIGFALIFSIRRFGMRWRCQRRERDQLAGMEMQYSKSENNQK